MVKMSLALLDGKGINNFKIYSNVNTILKISRNGDNVK